MDISVVILAAGQGTRMKSARPKVLQALADRPLLAHVLDTAAALGAAETCVVYGHGGETVPAAFAGRPVKWVLQAEQLGTGHAVQQAMPLIGQGHTALILCGDVPLVRPETLKTLLAASGGEQLAILTVEERDPTGYGRILRGGDGSVQGIVEEKDASEEQLCIREVNTGLMACPAKLLAPWLASLDNRNSQGEFYLTDVVALAVADGKPVAAVRAPSADEVMGINDRRQLARARQLLRRRVAGELMDQGVTLIDHERVDVRGKLSCGRDVQIDVNVVFSGDVRLGDGVEVGANTVICDTDIGPGTRIHPNCVIEDARVGASCEIGPFARVRPGTEMAECARLGNFVETKKSRIGEGSKVNHLTYLGDADIGRDVNVGAGTITCNYDGASKHNTVIGDGAFIGSGVMLVAPVEVGAGGTIGAGSTISRSTPPGELVLERSRQVVVRGWKRPVRTKDE